MKNMFVRVNKRLGFDANSKLPFEDIMLMHRICKFQKGFKPEELSVFCTAFDDDDLQVIILIERNGNPVNAEGRQPFMLFLESLNSFPNLRKFIVDN